MSAAPSPAVQPPDGGWGWAVVVGAFISIGFSFAFPKAITIFFKDIQKIFGASHSEIAWISSIMLAVMYAAGPISSILVNKYGSRPVVMMGGILCATGMFSASFCKNVLQLYVCAGFIVGLGLAFNLQPALTMIGKYWNKKRPMANGLAMTGSPVFLSILAPLNQYLFNTYGWSGSFLILAGVMLLSCVAGSLMRPLGPPPGKLQENIELESVKATKPGEDELATAKPEENKDEELASETGTEPEKQGEELASETGTEPEKQGEELASETGTKPEKQGGALLRAYQTVNKYLDLSLFKHRGFLIYLSGNVILFSGFFAPVVFLTNYAKSMGVPEYEAAFLLSIMAFTDMVARPSMGLFANSRWIRPRIQYFFSFAILLCGICHILCPLAETYTGLAIYTGFFGFTFGMVSSVLFETLQDLVGPQRFSSAMGLTTIVECCPVLLGPPLAGKLIDAGSYKHMYVTCGAIVIVASIWLFIGNFINYRLLERERKQHEPTLKLVQTENADQDAQGQSEVDTEAQTSEDQGNHDDKESNV